MCYPASSICGWDEVQHLWDVHHRMLLNILKVLLVRYCDSSIVSFGRKSIKILKIYQNGRHQPSKINLHRSGENILKCSCARPGKYFSRFSKVSYLVFMNIPESPMLVSAVS